MKNSVNETCITVKLGGTLLFEIWSYLGLKLMLRYCLKNQEPLLKDCIKKGDETGLIWVDLTLKMLI